MKYNKKDLSVKNHYYKIIPLALILLIVPCIVYLKTMLIEGVALDFSQNGEKYIDFFSYYKSIWLIIFTLFSSILCIIYMKTIKFNLKLPIIFVPLLVYYVFVFLSTVLSKHHDIAFFGFLDRFEGFFVISCYMLICLMAATFVTSEKDIKVLFSAIVACGFVLSIIGISQFWNFDFFQSNFGKRLILPKANYDLINSLTFKFPKQYIYSTLFNPNYVGSFFAMLFPVSIVFAIFSKKVSHKIISCIFSCVSFINLIGCLSSTGYIASVISIIFLIVVLNKNFFKAWHTMLILLFSFSVLLFWMNNVSNGTILAGFNLSFTQSSQAQPLQTEPSHSIFVEIKPQVLQTAVPKLLKIQTAQPQPIEAQTLDFQPKLVDVDAPTPQQDASLSQVVTKNITDFNIDKNTLTLYLGSSVVNITFNTKDSTCSFTDSSGKELKMVNDLDNANIIGFVDRRFDSITLKFDGNYITIYSPNFSFKVYISPEEKVFKFINHKGKPVDMDSSESIGFKGYELWGSSRGYIWSRSLPLLKDTLLIGHGPDTFSLYFPQNEFNGKFKYFNTPYIMVDKPHNMYLQIALNTGVLSLVAFLVFVLWFIINAIILYIRPKSINTYYIAGVSCVTAVVGFLVAGLANDSVIGVSSVFWILLGLGIACNRLYSKSIATVPSHAQHLPKNMKR